VLPRNRGLAGQVWKEMNQQITNYIRGKVLEMIVVGVATWIGFILLASTIRCCWRCWWGSRC
jgi:putative permease